MSAYLVLLVDLDPHFVKLVDDRTIAKVDTLAEAQGIYFMCPKCFIFLGGPIGCHLVHLWFKDRGVPDVLMPGPGRWTVDPSSTSYSDLTLTPSVHLMGDKACYEAQGRSGPGWHGHITKGQIV